MKISGIYKIQSKCKPERIYVGSAVNIYRRWNEHRKLLRENKHHSPKLQKHYNKYNGDLIFSILLACDVNDLVVNEQFFIDALRPYFNICLKAGSCLGMKLSEAAKRKISESNRRRIVSEATKEKMRIKLTGKTHSTESREKMSKSRKGRKFTENHKQKIREANKGKKFTDEHRMKLSIARKGRIITDETKKKLSLSHIGKKNALYGKHHSLETKNKLRELAKNQKHTEESKTKMSKAQKKRWDNVDNEVRNGFKMRAILLNHKRWHSDMKFESCPICNRDFDQAPTLEGPDELLDKLVFAVEKK
jgi:group I intron endonuclease